MNKKFIYLFLFFLIAAISLSPRFSFGYISGSRSIDIRIEDLIICIGLVAWVVCEIIKRRLRVALPPLFWPIFIWSAFGAFSIVFNTVFNGLAIDKAFFYFLKEIEFFLLYFLVFLNIKKSKETKILNFLSRSWLAFGLLNVFWIFYTIFFNSKNFYPYGPNAFMEPRGPFPSGGFFLILFIFFFNIFIFYYDKVLTSKWKKVAIFLVSIIPAVGVISSGSRASVIGLFASLGISFFVYLSDGLSLRKFMRITVVTSFLVGAFLLTIYVMPFPNVRRVIDFNHMKYEYTSESESSRGGILKDNVSEVFKSAKTTFFGVGVYGEAHSQYMRVILERGVIGIILFLWLMASIFKSCLTSLRVSSGLQRGLVGGLLTATIVMLIMAIPNDSFMVVKIDEAYWFFAAMAMSTVAFNNSDNFQRRVKRYTGFDTRKFLVLDNIEIDKSRSYLEVGVGIGDLVDRIDGQVEEYYGVDISNEAIDYLKGIYEKRPLLHFIHLDVCSGSSTLNKRFDVIFSADTLEHVGSATNFFNFIKKHLNKNGTAMIIFPNESLKKHHGITWFNDKISLENIIKSAGLKVDSLLEVRATAWHSLIKTVLWDFPKKIGTKENNLPQTFDKTNAFGIVKANNFKTKILTIYLGVIVGLAQAFKLHKYLMVKNDIENKNLLIKISNLI